MDGVSLSLRRGQILAIVGANRSGKSTLTRLLTGIHLPDKGRVTWNGTDLAEVDPATVWANTGLVPQIFAQWPLRVRENVTLGQPFTHDDAPVWAALDAVGLREAVEDLPTGLDTLLARDVRGPARGQGGGRDPGLGSRPDARPPGLRDEPIDTEVHAIDPDPARGEAAHWHYDVRIAFYLADGAPELTLQAEDITGSAWLRFDEVSSPALREELTGSALNGVIVPVNASAIIHDGNGQYLLHLRAQNGLAKAVAQEATLRRVTPDTLDRLPAEYGLSPQPWNRVLPSRQHRALRRGVGRGRLITVRYLSRRPDGPAGRRLVGGRPAASSTV